MGKPGVLQSTGSLRVGHDLATEQKKIHSITFMLCYIHILIYVYEYMYKLCAMV